MKQSMYNTICTSALQHIMQSINNEISMRQLTKKNLCKYTAIMSISLFEQLANQLLITPMQLSELIQDKQIAPIIRDTLMPLFIHKINQSQTNIHKPSINSIPPHSDIQSNNTDDAVKKLITLKLNHQNGQDNHINQLRQKLQKKELLTRKKNIQITKPIPKPNYPVYYEYDGTFQKQKPQTQRNLVQHKLTVQTTPSQKLKTVQSISRQPIKLEVRKMSKGKLIKQDNQVEQKSKKTSIQFSNVTNLCQKIDKVEKGIKISNQFQTIQEKKKKSSILEIKQLMKTRYLSKNQYLMLKTGQRAYSQHIKTQEVIERSNNNTQIKQIKTRKQKNLTQISQPKKDKHSQSSRIVVNSLNLKQRLIYNQQSEDDAPVNFIQLSKQDFNKSEKLSLIDVYNINYYRKKQLVSKERLQTLQPTSLPFVHKKHQQIKSRQRLKDTFSLIRSMKKKFQDRLRQ